MQANPLTSPIIPRQADAIFNAALDLPAEARETFVAAQCGDDAALHARVLRLLAAYEASDDFLKTAVISPENRPGLGRSLAEMSGECIGPYRLVEQLGEGGFGVVWLAEQGQPVKRQVALKIIRLGMDTEEVIARFSQERQALAVMDHPNIAKVFDAGATPTGRPFFVMELVRGAKITEFCDEGGLSTAQRLELFVQVCHAVQHAHQKGIIHRDLKPSNILVTVHDGLAVPKVIDFGVAKATGEERLAEVSLRTMADQMVGTPLYMSPEQASLGGSDIDTRSDIYSLGVLLYEMLTGRPPFDAKTLMAAGFDEMRRIIREVEPPRPSARLTTLAGADLETTARLHGSDARRLTSVLRGDLDWIVMKAIEKDRTRRYESANGLAMDIQRHLHNEPVNARPPSTGYRVRRWVKRNKLAFAAGVSIAAVLLLGMALTTWQAIRATRAEHEQARLREAAETEAARSAQTSAFLQSTLGAVDPKVAEGRDTTLLRMMLDLAAQRVASELKDQPDVEADLRTTIGEAYVSIGESAKGEQMHREALRIRQALHGPEHRDVSRSLHKLGFALAHQGRYVDAEAAMREALRIYRKLRAEPDLTTATMLGEMVWPLTSNNKASEAVAHAREALDIRLRLSGDEHSVVAVSRKSLSDALLAAGDVEGAEREALEAVALRRRLEATGSFITALCLKSLGFIQLKRGKAVEAENTLREAVAMMRAKTEAQGSQVADVLPFFGQALQAQDKWEEAEAVAREFVAIRQAKQSPDHPHQVWALLELERVLRKRGNLAEAETIARQMIEWQIKKNGPEHETVAGAIMILAEVLQAASRKEEAAQEIAKAVAIRKLPAPAPLPVADSEAQMLLGSGSYAGRMGDWSKAAQAMKQAVVADRRVLGSHVSTVKLAAALIEAGDIAGYRELCASLSSDVTNTRNPSSATCLARVGLLLPETGFTLEDCGRLADLAVTQGAKSDLLPWYLGSQALSEYRRGRYEEVIRVASVCLADPRTVPDCRVLANPVLAMAHHQAGRAEEARAALQAAVKDQSAGWFNDTRKDLGSSWQNWLVGHILLREARALIESTASSASQAQ